MKNNTRHFTWYLFIFFCITEVFFLIVSTLLAFDLIDLTRIHINNHISLFASRILVTTILHFIVLFIFLKKKYFKNKTFTTVLSLFSTTVFLDTIGNLLDWYDKGKLLDLFYFDDFVHFLFPLIIFFGIHLLSKKKNLLLTSTITLSIVTLWEVYEYWADMIFKSTMVAGIDDTMTDITFGFAAILLGIVILKILPKKNFSKE